MKIVILAQPRSGTKFIQENLFNYLENNFKNVLSLTNSRGLDEILNPRHFTLRSKKIDKIIKNKIILSSSKTDNEEDYKDKIYLLNLSKFSWVTKVFPFQTWHDEYVFDNLFPKVDKIYIINRNQKDLILSRYLSRTLDIWSTGSRLNDVLKNLDNYKIKINKDELEKIRMLIDYHYNDFVPKVEKMYSKKIFKINFDNLYSLNSSVDFAKLFNLNNSNFQFSSKQLEFGKYKYDMVKFYDN